MIKIKLVDDKELVAEIKQQLKENDGYCPCRLSKIPENKCMCKEFRDSPIGTICTCGLYIKIEE